jgi:hypothetical protein
MYTGNPKYPHQCPSCHQDNETQPHLLLCPAASRQEARCLMMTQIRKHLDAAETNLELMTIALDGIQSVFTSTTLDHSRYSHIYGQLLEEQAYAGRTNFLKGRLTTQWALHQDSHLNETTRLHTSKRNGTTWANNLASTMLNEWLSIWKLRNEGRHGREKTE